MELKQYEDLNDDEINKINENQKEERIFAKNLTKLLKGDKMLASKPLLVGKTPNAIAICTEQGILDLVITKSVIQKCMRSEIRDESGIRKKHSGHALTKQQITDIIWAIKRPILIMKGSQMDSLAVMTDVRDKNDQEIFVYISLHQSVGFDYVNSISSAYSKDELKSYLEQNIEKGNIIAIDKQKTDEMCRSIGVDFPEETSFISFNASIAYSLSSVKYPRTVKNRGRVK